MEQAIPAALPALAEAGALVFIGHQLRISGLLRANDGQVRSHALATIIACWDELHEAPSFPQAPDPFLALPQWPIRNETPVICMQTAVKLASCLTLPSVLFRNLCTCVALHVLWLQCPTRGIAQHAFFLLLIASQKWTHHCRGLAGLGRRGHLYGDNHHGALVLECCPCLLSVSCIAH